MQSQNSITCHCITHFYDSLTTLECCRSRSNAIEDLLNAGYMSNYYTVHDAPHAQKEDVYGLQVVIGLAMSDHSCS
jgi:methyl coenzyme M reductase alpha subunit